MFICYYIVEYTVGNVMHFTKLVAIAYTEAEINGIM